MGPLLDLTVQPPKVESPLATVGGLMQMRDVQSQIALRNQQTATALANQRDIAAQADQRQADVNDQNTIQQKMLDPAFAHSVSSWDGSSAFPLDGIVQPRTATAYKTAVTAQQKAQLGLSGEQLTDFQNRHKVAAQSLQGLLYQADGTPQDDATIAARAPAMISELVKDKIVAPETAAQIDITDFKSGQKFAAINGYLDGLNDNALKNKGAAQKILTDASTAAMDAAHAGQYNADAAKLIADKQSTLASLPSVQAKAQNDAADAAFRAAHGGLGAEEIQTNATARATAAAATQNASINAQKFAVEFGGDAVKGWAAQVRNNPDSANDVPAALRTAVMQQFSAANGLPFPKPLTGTAVDQERAAVNTLQKIPRIQQLLADPEISSRVGPILGRLGNVEQAVGTAVGLSPSASAKAQELRTLMRYTVFGEGKSLLGGRLPQQLMSQLETSSVKDTMDPDVAKGALTAMGGAANDVLDSTFKQRYGAAAVRPASADTFPAAAKAQLREGQDTTFGNGQVWTLVNGVETRVK